jgi:hypothetical protein
MVISLIDSSYSILFLWEENNIREKIDPSDFPRLI